MSNSTNLSGYIESIYDIMSEAKIELMASLISNIEPITNEITHTKVRVGIGKVLTFDQ